MLRQIIIAVTAAVIVQPAVAGVSYSPLRKLGTLNIHKQMDCSQPELVAPGAPDRVHGAIVPRSAQLERHRLNNEYVEWLRSSIRPQQPKVVDFATIIRLAEEDTRQHESTEDLLINLAVSLKMLDGHLLHYAPRLSDLRQLALQANYFSTYGISPPLPHGWGALYGGTILDPVSVVVLPALKMIDLAFETNAATDAYIQGTWLNTAIARVSPRAAQYICEKTGLQVQLPSDVLPFDDPGPGYLSKTAGYKKFDKIPKPSANDFRVRLNAYPAPLIAGLYGAGSFYQFRLQEPVPGEDRLTFLVDVSDKDPYAAPTEPAASGAPTDAAGSASTIGFMPRTPLPAPRPLLPHDPLYQQVKAETEWLQECKRCWGMVVTEAGAAALVPFLTGDPKRWISGGLQFIIVMAGGLERCREACYGHLKKTIHTEIEKSPEQRNQEAGRYYEAEARATSQQDELNTNIMRPAGSEGTFWAPPFPTAPFNRRPQFGHAPVPSSVDFEQRPGIGPADRPGTDKSHGSPLSVELPRIRVEGKREN